jgi:integrase
LILVGKGATGGQSSASVADVCDTYLGWLERNRKPTSYRRDKASLSDFAKWAGPDTVADKLAPSALLNWLESHQGWLSPYSFNRARASVMAAFNHCVARGMIKVNPFTGRCHTQKTLGRVTLFSQDQEALLFQFAPRNFADYLRFLFSTGSRPDEGARIEAKDLRETPFGLTCVLDDWKNARKSGKPRTIYLDPVTANLVRRLALVNPVGPIFVSPSGNPWCQNSRGSQFKRVKAAIVKAHGQAAFDKGLTLYSCRHTRITRLIADGKPVAIVAELCGTSIRMIEKHYAHLSLVPSALWSVVGGGMAVSAVG